MINLIERYHGKNYKNYLTEYYKVPTSTALFNRLAMTARRGKYLSRA